MRTVVIIALGFILFSAWVLLSACEEKLWPKNLTLSGVRIYYSDKTVDVFTLEEWNAAPNDDVQISVVFFRETYKPHGESEKPYRFLCHSEDLHWWGGCGGPEQARKYAPEGSVKDTKWMMPNERWEARYREAETDMRPPAK